MNPTFISCVPNEKRFEWEVAVFLNNLREFGYSKNANILIFIPEGRAANQGWQQLQELFPETGFFFYEDRHSAGRLITAFNYQPIIRPYLLREHFANFSHLEKETIFYCDTDIVFTKKLDFSPFMDNNICYLSDTNSYINSSYFDSKEKDVIPHRLENYKTKDILQECLDMFSLKRETAEKNKENSGGAQYLLKGVTSKFWNDVLEGCLFIRLHLRQVNQRFFESENKGFQSWCADMWSLLWTLWKYGKETRCPKELDFLWSTDDAKKWTEYYIYHNAGVTEESTLKRKTDKIDISCPAFYKGKYTLKTPFEDTEYLNTIINNPVSGEFANSLYVREILKTKQNLNF